jgi:hypothetical protein
MDRLANKKAKKEMIYPDVIVDKDELCMGVEKSKEERLLKSPERLEIEENEKKEEHQPHPKAFYDDWDNNLFAENMNNLQRGDSQQPDQLEEEK